MKNSLNERLKAHGNLIKQQNLFVYIKGVFRRWYYIHLQKKFKFDNWHVIPYELRPYAWYLVHYINNHMNIKSVAEIGCGLGDIIRNISANYKTGVDLSQEVLNCASFLDHKKSGKCKFKKGVFGKVINGIPEELDLLITVNFIHNIPEDTLKISYADILKKVKVQNIIVDGKSGKNYKYHHMHWSRIVPGYNVTVIWNSEDVTLYRLERKNNELD